MSAAEWTGPMERIEDDAVETTATRSLRLAPTHLVILGLLLVGGGFGLIAITWARISPLKIVAQQLPYLVSAGFTGVGLIVFGAALLIAASKRADDEIRRAQSTELITALRELREALDLDAATPPAAPAKRTPRKKP